MTTPQQFPILRKVPSPLVILLHTFFVFPVYTNDIIDTIPTFSISWGWPMLWQMMHPIYLSSLMIKNSLPILNRYIFSQNLGNYAIFAMQ